MKNKSVIFLVVALCLFTSPSSFATDDAHRKAAHDLLDTMNLNELMAQSIESMMQIDLLNNPSMFPYEDTMREFFNKHMSGESMRDDYVDLYTEFFSEEELIEMNKFYNTPTGQKTIKLTPELMARGAMLGQNRVKENVSELMAMIEEEAKRIQEAQNQE